MGCSKFRAFARSRVPMTATQDDTHPRTARALCSAALVLAACAAVSARAEKADRQQPLTIEADQGSTVDLARRVVVFNGRVVLTQGSLRILADRVEVAEVGEGQRTAQARGRPEQPAQFRVRVWTNSWKAAPTSSNTTAVRP
jgi:lipopolysaccharide export system protein LptA